MNFEPDSLPLPTFAVDAKGSFGVGNRAWQEFAGETAMLEATEPARRDAVRATMAAGLRGGMPFVFTADLRRKDGVYRAHQLHARPGAGSAWVVIAVEMEPRSAAAATPASSAPEPPKSTDPFALERRDEVVVTPPPEIIEDFRRQMLGLVGHDLRNPLNAVVMASSLVRSRAKTEAEVKLIDRVIHAADRLTRMITQLLDFTACRLGGRLELMREPAELASLVVDAVGDLATARKVHVAMDLATTPMRGWDTTRIEHIVSNLVLNAILHGKPPVRVALHERGDRSILEVHDAGGLLETDSRDHLFAPTRKRLSTTREAGSLGLGLYVTEQIVQAFGGRIDVRSNPDEGTVFTVELPHVEATETS